MVWTASIQSSGENELPWKAPDCIGNLCVSGLRWGMSRPPKRQRPVSPRPYLIFVALCAAPIPMLTECSLVLVA